jgi:hypothetical protein
VFCSWYLLSVISSEADLLIFWQHPYTTEGGQILSKKKAAYGSLFFDDLTVTQ